MHRPFHLTRSRLKILLWIIIIVVVILGINQLGTRSGDHQTDSINPNHGVAKTYDTKVGKPSKKYLQDPNQHHNHYSGHLKDRPGNDNNPKKG